MPTVTFVNQDKQVEVAAGLTVLAAAGPAGVPVEGNCGGKGVCGKCKVRVLGDARREPGSFEMEVLTESERAEGWVLACRYIVDKDLRVEVQELQDAFRRKAALGWTELRAELGRQGGFKPTVEKIYLELEPPSVRDQTPDYERLTEALRIKQLKGKQPKSTLIKDEQIKDEQIKGELIKDELLRAEQLKGGQAGGAQDDSVQDERMRDESMLDRSVQEEGLQEEGVLVAGKELDVNLEVLSGLPGKLRGSGFKVTAVLEDNRLLAVEAGDTASQGFGVAFDIGTTTIVGSLIDLLSGQVLGSAALTNPQNVYGADVISRIDHASKGSMGRQQLQDKVIGAVNEIISRLTIDYQVDRQKIYQVTIVGNTTMSHLFLGIDPVNLVPAPFIPAFRQAVRVPAARLGIDICPSGSVHVLPNVAGYVGSDTVAVMLATRIRDRQGLCLAMDIGTNGELVLGEGGRLLTCSTAAGPAFEGAQIHHGMRAADGAIEGVTIGDTVEVKIIGGGKARGICGSGLIDAIAAMLEAGIISSSGRLVNPEKADRLQPQIRERIVRGEGGWQFVLVPAEISATGEDIVLTQKDIREFQLAKGAIGAGINILLKEMGKTVADLDQVLIAGAFGSHIDPDSALKVGLLPKIPRERIQTVGNAAGDGSKLALVSRIQRQEAAELAKSARHVELSARADFREEFLRTIQFPDIKHLPDRKVEAEIWKTK